MMRKNNKGFAVSTLLYGLSIMGFLIVILLMNIMSSNRVNTSNFVSQVEDELNRYSLTESSIRAGNASSDGSQEFIVPYGQEGWYKIELWGASGGANGSHQGGKGSYTSGVIYLEENTHLYFYIGTKGSGTTGGKNLGGNGNGTTSGGGGATDVRLISGYYTDEESLKSRIMVAGGGGGATTSQNGGKGGDLQGYKGDGTSGSAGQVVNSFAVATGSGGGFKNGGASEGGSSYISGYAGGSSFVFDDSDINNASFKNQQLGTVSIYYKNPVYYSGDVAENFGDIVGYDAPDKGYSFLNGYMVAGVNDGDGRASIQRVTTNNGNLEKKTNLNNIKKIVDCVDNGTTEWKEIQAISSTFERGGVNLAKEATASISSNPAATNPNNAKDGRLDTSATVTATATEKCLTVTFSTNVNLDEIAVWHKNGDVAKHSLKACTSTSDSTCLVLSNFNGTDADPIKETTNGLHYSAYRFNTSQAPENGIYYIVPVNNEAVTFTTGNSTLASSDMTITLKNIDGTRFQKWRLENAGGIYTIVETQNYNTIQINSTEATVDEYLKAQPRLPNNDIEKWRITPTGNGQYVITSVFGSKLNFDGNTVKTASSTTTGQGTKFYLINIDY